MSTFSSGASARPVRIGLVGLGWVATNRHLPTLRLNPAYQVVGVADREGLRAKHWADRLGIARSCQASSIAEIDWLDEVDAIDVTASPMTHYSLARDALLQDKHVITEKPFAMTVAEGEELVALAAQRQKQLAVVHNFQFASATLRLRADIESGRLGTLRSISVNQWGNPSRRLPAWYQQLPAGLLFDESPHPMYLIKGLSPGPLRLTHVEHCASTTGNQTPASVDVNYRCAAGGYEIPVTVNCRFEAPVSEWHVSVLGDRGAGILDIFRDIYVFLPNDGRHVASTVLRTSWYATAMHWARHFVNGPLILTGRLLYGYEEVFQRFGEAIRQGVAPRGLSGQDALDVLRMQHDILERLKERA